MQVLIIADTHHGCHRSNLAQQNKWLDEHIKFYQEFFIPLIQERLDPEKDLIVHLGDVFDNKDHIDIGVLNAITSQYYKICKMGYKIHILAGNHDLYLEKIGKVSSVALFNLIPNVKVYHQASKQNWAGQTTHLIPYQSDVDWWANYLEQESGDYLLAHTDLFGSKMNQGTKTSSHPVRVKDFKNFKQIFSGHIHIQQSFRNGEWLYVGNPYHLDRNDRGEEKGVWLVDWVTKEREFIVNTINPHYVKFEINSLNDLDGLEQQVGHNYADLIINHKLIQESKKLHDKLKALRRKIKISKILWTEPPISINENTWREIKNTTGNEKIDGAIQEAINSLDYEDPFKNRIRNILTEIKKQSGN